MLKKLLKYFPTGPRRRVQRALFRRVTIGAVRMEQNKVTGEQQVTPLSEEELARLQQRSGKEGEQAARIAAQIAEARERGLTVAQFDAIREMGGRGKKPAKKAALVGIAVAAIFSVPLANLLAPVIGTAAAVHLFERHRAMMAP